MNLTITKKKVKYSRACITLLLTGLIAGSVNRLSAQSIGFIQQDIIKKPGIYTDVDITGLPTGDRQTTRSYYDGLGETIQAVGVKSSPSAKDIIQPYAYDNLGRQVKSYLPYAATDGSGTYRSNAISSEQSAFYSNGTADKVADDSSPYSQRYFEASPLQRLLITGRVGDGYQFTQTGGRYKNVSYRSNNSGDGNIIIWGTDGSNLGSYSASALSVTEGTDEDQVKTVSFTDLAGHTALKRQYTGATGVYLDTYYIYNTAGLVSYVIPPKAMATMVANSSYSLSQTGVNKLIFQYWYDNQGRVIQKLVPGSGIINIIYDPLNRPVLIQDAKMALSYKWYYIKYDAKDHPVSHGIYIDPNSYSATAMQNAVTNNTVYNTYWYESRSTNSAGGYYTNNTFPTTGITPLAYNYFDNYDLDLSGTDDYGYTSQGLSNEGSQTSAPTIGMLTMTRKATMGSGITTGTWLISYMFYDKYGHVIQTKNNNQIIAAVSDIKTIALDFTGAPIQTRVIKVTGSTTTSVLTTIGYDPMHRVNTIDQSYNGATATRVATYFYNELGQLVSKKLGFITGSTIPDTLNLNSTYSGTNTFVAGRGITLSPGFSVPSGSTFQASIATNYLQTVDYRYNSRGQLLSINNSKLNNDGAKNNDSNDLFGMELLYDQADANVGNTGWFNGKLSAVKWMSKDADGTSSYERSYKYSYDALDRFTGAGYAERTGASTGAFSNNVGGFNENVGSYDVNGNILSLTRNSSTQGANTNVQMDNLSYTYNSANPNQLQKVSDGAGVSYTGYGFRNLTAAPVTSTYSYDVNGNLTADPYKGLTLAYNDLNRTDKITVTTATNRYIDYTYDATGTLIRKQAYDNNVLQTTTDYIDGFVYINNALSYFPMPEGRVRNTGSSLKPEYIITDQQGNARISFEDNGSGLPVVRQENSYYAFGLSMPNSPVAIPTAANKQLYNGGSEWQNDYGYLPDLQQTFYRNYDAAMGRFIAVDPLAEQTESMSVYQYANNNPVMFNDPMGDYMVSPSGIRENGISSWTVGTSTLAEWKALYARHPIDSPGEDAFPLGSAFMQGGTGGGGSSYTLVHTDNGDFNLSEQELYELLGKNIHALPLINITAFRNNNLPLWWGRSELFMNNLNANYANQEGNENESWTKKGNDLIGSLGVGWGAKENLLDYAAKLSPEVEELSYFKAVKVGSKALLGAQVVVSGYQAISAWHNSDGNWRNNQGNKWGVTGKAALDVTMGAIGTFGGPIGWGISGTYFIGDYFGVWGTWANAPKP